jgi:hypothetical protein
MVTDKTDMQQFYGTSEAPATDGGNSLVNTTPQPTLKPQTPAELPDHGTKYFKGFWGAYKGHVRSLLRGLLVGAFAGLAVGIGLAILWPILVPAGGALAALGGGALAAIGGGSLIATFTGVGAIFGAELMGKIGNSAGNAAAFFAESEMRQRYPSLPEISRDSPAPGIGHHFEVPPDDDKWFHGRIALPGLLVGTAIGALLAFGTGGAGVELLGEFGLHAFEHLGGHVATTAATVGAGGLMGASFGLNRGKFKSIFNYTDNVLMGKPGNLTQEQIERDQARYKERDPNQPDVITGTQRHDEYQRLLTGYYNKAAAAGWSGDRRGFLGGLVAGVFSGLLAAGIVSIGLVAVLGATPVVMSFIPIIFSVCAALGGKQGMNIFSDAGRESAAFSVADEIYKERIKTLETGKDITFDEAEKNACKRLTFHPDMDPPGTEIRTWFNWKIGIAGLLAGALAGVALAPIGGAFLSHIFLLHGVSALSLMPVTAATFGLAGATFGMGDKTMDKLYDVTDNMFMGTFFPGHSAHDHKIDDYPPLAPDSPLLPANKMKAAIAANGGVIPSIAPIAEAASDRPPTTAVAAPNPKYLNTILEAGSNSRTITAPVAKDPSFVNRALQSTPAEPALGRA